MLNKITGQTVFTFEILSLAIKRIASLIFLIIWTYECVFNFEVMDLISLFSDNASLSIGVKLTHCLQYTTYFVYGIANALHKHGLLGIKYIILSQDIERCSLLKQLFEH